MKGRCSMKPVQAYKCDYCNRCFTRPASAHNHEVCCKNNPERKMCVTCKNCLIKEDKSQPLIHIDYGKTQIYGDSPTCVVLNKPIYEKPYFDECDTSGPYEYGETETEIPGTCWNYEYKGYAKFEAEPTV